jgi:hypothetical protein
MTVRSGQPSGPCLEEMKKKRDYFLPVFGAVRVNARLTTDSLTLFFKRWKNNSLAVVLAHASILLSGFAR